MVGNTLQKASATLGGVPLAATSGIAWKFVSGTAPYVTVMSVHISNWDDLKGQRGKPISLEITDSRGTTMTIEKVYVLHEAPSSSPHLKSFVVADLRWRWPYKLVVRDFNMPRKTGDRTPFNQVPIENQQVVDKYDYLPYSVDPTSGQRWTARSAVEEVLDLLEPSNPGPRGGNGPPAPGGGSASTRIDSFPIHDRGGSGGEFTLQGVQLRDQGDVALARLLSFVPGADVFIDAKGTAVVFDASDLNAVDQYFAGLPPDTWDGDAAVDVLRTFIRPERITVRYQREIEVKFDYSDDYGPTVANPGKNAPFLENVLPTVDPVTIITQYDPESDSRRPRPVPPGTWVSVRDWLDAMDQDRPDGSAPWNFETIRQLWVAGDLEGALGAKGQDLNQQTVNVPMRVQALREHFRQTFRINRRYMERIRELRAVRVALLDPVTGARGHASVWGQACIIPTAKGYMADRGRDGGTTAAYHNVDFFTPTQQGGRTIDKTPSPAGVEIVDEELGIFRITWKLSPFGTGESIIPCLLTEEGGQPRVPQRDMALQDDQPMAAGLHIESGTNGIFLSKTLRLSVMMTIVPASPNDETQCHPVTVHASDVAGVFRTAFRIQSGSGPDLDVFVPPGEVTARFAWQDDSAAFGTLERLLGLVDASQLPPGTPPLSIELPGFLLINEERSLTNHAISVGAELLTPFADNVQGDVATALPVGGVQLRGNMSGATVRVAAYPSAKVDAVHSFPGQQRKISRLALMPESARRILLGTLPYR
jgi:hypothetical protein